MYVRPISTRFSRGRLTPAIRAIPPLPLPLLVTGVAADHHHGAAAPDRPALLAHRLDARPDLHDSSGCSMVRRRGPTRCTAPGTTAPARHAARSGRRRCQPRQDSRALRPASTAAGRPARRAYGVQSSATWWTLYAVLPG